MYFDNTYWLLFTLIVKSVPYTATIFCSILHRLSEFLSFLIHAPHLSGKYQQGHSSEAGTNFARNVRQFRLRSTTVILLRDLHHAVKFCNVGPTALLPLRRNSCYGYLSPLKIHRPRPGLNPRTSSPIASTITTRPPRPTLAPLPVSYECMSVRLWYSVLQPGDKHSLWEMLTLGTNFFTIIRHVRQVSVWLWLDDRAIQIRSPAEAKEFFL
jgi:hypothetical protein